MEMQVQKKKVAVIVAHPDDETLWAGGMLLNNPDWDCFIVTLCRKYDSDRAPKFYKALDALHSTGIMGDLDDGPDQIPLDQLEIDRLILQLLPIIDYDLILTHNPLGEYTRHLRHEEIGISVISLWYEGKISSKELMLFAYEDHNKQYHPKAITLADVQLNLPTDLWQKKYEIVTQIYGFTPDSWEAKTTPKTEAYWKFTNKKDAWKWLKNVKL
ncbi:PIG-L family deacetylase [Flavobacterium sp. LS1R49]|uniref:PIG-L family deacetylase n=1 Tax=Flavobacterium shii TaxID=2987687 RepID=A0A9X2ZD37_9FLAO|nr:PIG-L family deacetylase [Flavobacterium shii]MCV9927532.1 PIG-L family deacetylase [Flavobacterium shii]